MANDLADLVGPDERIVLETRQHWFVAVRDTIVPMAVTAGLVLAAWYASGASWLDNQVGAWVGTGLWMFVAGTFVLVVWRALGWITERFYVTTSKVVYARGVLNRSVTATPLAKIDEVTLARPLVGRVFGYGRLDVENSSGGTEPLAGLEYLPNPVEIYRIVNERSRHQRMVEGGAHRDDDGDGLADAAPPVSRPAPASEARDTGTTWSPPGDPTSSA